MLPTHPWPGHLVTSGGIFVCHCWKVKGVCVTGIYWAEARDTAKHPIEHRAFSHNKNDPGKMLIVPKSRNPVLD